MQSTLAVSQDFPGALGVKAIIIIASGGSRTCRGVVQNPVGNGLAARVKTALCLVEDYHVTPESLGGDRSRMAFD